MVWLRATWQVDNSSENTWVLGSQLSVVWTVVAAYELQASRCPSQGAGWWGWARLSVRGHLKEVVFGDLPARPQGDLDTSASRRPSEHTSLWRFWFQSQGKAKGLRFCAAHNWAKVCLWIVQALLQVPYPHPSCPHLAQGWLLSKPLFWTLCKKVELAWWSDWSNAKIIRWLITGTH